MARSFSATIAQKINAERSDALPLILIKATHSDFGSEIRVVNNTQDVVSNGHTFKAFPFDIILPSDQEEQQPVMKLIGDNASLELVSNLRAIAGSREFAQFTVQLIEFSEPDTIILEWPAFELRNVPYDLTKISLELTVKSFLNEPFPGDSFTPAGFPGLF